jgi:hypothetical protein
VVSGLKLGRCQELSSTRWRGPLGTQLGQVSRVIIYKTILQNPQANPLENHYTMEWAGYTSQSACISTCLEIWACPVIPH